MASVIASERVAGTLVKSQSLLAIAKAVICSKGFAGGAVLTIPAGILCIAIEGVVGDEATVKVALHGYLHTVYACAAVGSGHGDGVDFSGGWDDGPLRGGGAAVAPLVDEAAGGGEGEGLVETDGLVGAGRRHCSKLYSHCFALFWARVARVGCLYANFHIADHAGRKINLDTLPIGGIQLDRP